MGKIDLISFQELSAGRKSLRLEQRLWAQVARDGGAAVAVIHPLSSMMAIDYPGRLAINPHVQKVITRERYDAYLDRLQKYLFRLDRSLVVFLEEKNMDMARIWLQGLEVRDPVVAVRTEARSPMPWIDDLVDEAVAWKILGSALQDRGISNLTLIGELAYEDDSGKQGCVYNAFAMLSPHVPALSIVPEVTFPNVKVPGRKVFSATNEFFQRFPGIR
jgi:hypothetical protein